MGRQQEEGLEDGRTLYHGLEGRQEGEGVGGGGLCSSS